MRKKSLNEKQELRREFSKKILDKMNIKISVKNEEKIPEGKLIVIVNHRSVIDPLVLELAIRKNITPGVWLAKKELFKSPFFGIFTRNAGAISVDREGDKKEFFKEVNKSVKEGNSLFLFPEGTRNKTDNNLIEFKGGADFFAKRNKTLILPVFISTRTNEISKKSLSSAEEQNIEVIIGNLIDISKIENTLEEEYKNSFSI